MNIAFRAPTDSQPELSLAERDRRWRGIRWRMDMEGGEVLGRHLADAHGKLAMAHLLGSELTPPKE